MVSRENEVTIGLAATGLLLAFGGRAVTEIDYIALIGILIFVGVLTPQLLNRYLDNRGSDE